MTKEWCLKNGAWDLGEVPHLAPEGGLVLQRQSRVSQCYRIAETHDGLEGVSRKIRTTKERFLIVFRETIYTMLGNLRIKAM